MHKCGKCGSDISGLLWFGKDYLCWMHYWDATYAFRIARAEDAHFNRRY